MPYDPNTVLSVLDLKFKTPSPLSSTYKEVKLQTSKTPNNIIETALQHKYLKDQIKYYQGSSLLLIIKALNYFLKGVKLVIYYITLLKEEVKDLQEANNILSRRRRTRKTRLQQSRSMTLREGQD